MGKNSIQKRMVSCQIEVISLLSRRSFFFGFWDKCRLKYFEAHAWRGVTASNYPVHSDELKRLIRAVVMLPFVLYFEASIQLPLHLRHLTCTLRNLGRIVF